MANVARRIVDDSDAPDVVQEIFTKLFSRPNLYKPGNFKAFLRRTVINESLQLLRKRRVVTPLDEAEAIPSSAPSQEYIVILERDLRSALGRLRPEQLEVIIGHDIEGYGFDELAEQLNTAASTLRRRHAEALAVLGAYFRRGGRFGIPSSGSPPAGSPASRSRPPASSAKPVMSAPLAELLGLLGARKVGGHDDE